MPLRQADTRRFSRAIQVNVSGTTADDFDARASSPLAPEVSGKYPGNTELARPAPLPLNTTTRQLGPPSPCLSRCVCAPEICLSRDPTSITYPQFPAKWYGSSGEYGEYVTAETGGTG